MLVIHEAEGTCPMCGNRNRLRAVGGGFALGQDSDLLVRMEGQHVIQAEVHSCRRCRFSGTLEDFEATFSRALAERFLAEVMPKLTGCAGAAPTPDIQYLWAYRCGCILSKPDRELGTRLLRAYWCLRLPPSSELPQEELATRRKLYLAGAIHHFRLACRSEESPVQFYILAELCRRGLEFPAAVTYFKKFLDFGSGDRGGLPKYLRLAAIKLLRASERSDGREHSMEELVYADSKEE